MSLKSFAAGALTPLASLALLALSAGAQAPRPVAPVASPVAAAVAPGTFVIDAAHSQVGFKVRHLGISTVTGQVAKFAGTFAFDSANPSASRVDVTIDASSVDTHIERRDADLRSENFFWVEKYPTISFVSRTINRIAPTKFRVLGDLTIRGVTKPVVLHAELGGILKLQNGTSVAALSATTTINRFDYGLTWNRMTEGVANVAPEVQIVLDVEAKQAK